MKYDLLCEMDAADIVKSLTSNGVQKDTNSNVGQFGSIQPKVTSINISKTPCGCIQLEVDSMCIKLKPIVIEALKKFFEITDNIEGVK